VSRHITLADRQTEMSEEEGSEMVQRAPQAIGSLIPRDLCDGMRLRKSGSQ